MHDRLRWGAVPAMTALAAAFLMLAPAWGAAPAVAFDDPPSAMTEMSLREVLEKAEAFSPQIKAMLAQENMAKTM